MGPFWIFDWDTFYWEVGGMLTGFFGGASVAISVWEPVLGDRPFDTTLFAFGAGCLLISLLGPRSHRPEKRWSLNQNRAELLASSSLAVRYFAHLSNDQC